jgi:Tol biopolymer transport system component
MTLPAGTRLGPYEILSPLGAGGMGEVYRARDTRLGRDVAVKVLPSHLSDSPELKQRFEREAKAISQLTHPHICTLYDVGSQDGVEYLVMELLEGETLADRLGKGALPRDQVIRCGIEITEALEKAHRGGIVHRDLKPGNIMLTKSGVKLLDFGLAKMVAGPVLPAKASSLPTQGVPSQPLTEQGTVMGTFQYMAPEQLEGTEADVRTDIFALGTVLYEMATGRKAFTGKSRVSLIGSILKDEPPPISSIEPMTPPALDRLVQTCLAKEPDDRFQTAHDVKLQLRWIEEGGSQAGAPAVVVSRRRSRERLAWAVAGIAAVAALLLAALHFGNPRERPRTVQASILPPEKSAFVFDGVGPMALSPDGTRLAFVAATPEGKNLLWARPLNGMSAQPLPGTEDASYPFWSPDSRFLGFFAAGVLKKMDASGGPSQTVCDAATTGRGGTWNRDGVIVFARPRGPLMRVSSEGGTPVPLADLDASRGEYSHRLPFFLPDGRHYLYLARSNPSGDPKDAEIVYAGSLDSKERKLLARVYSNATYAASSAGASHGYLLFARENTVVAQPFDPNGLRFTGEAVPIGDSVSFSTSIGYAAFTASNTGAFAYLSGANLSQPIWFDRTGRQLEALGSPADYRRVRLSHDGRQATVDIADSQSDRSYIWTIDLQRHISTRLTFGPLDYMPIWSPDDRRIAFSSDREGMSGVYTRASTGTGEEEVLVPPDKSFKFSTDWSSDGKSFLYSVLGAEERSSWNIFTFSFVEKKRAAFLATPANEYQGVFSPDGRWTAYASDESGKFEIYVQPLSGHGGKWQISNAGGDQPVWGRDGREIFYVAPDNKLMAVGIETSQTFAARTPQPLFEVRIRSVTGRRYDVSADGRFLINTVAGDTKGRPITLVQNWASELKR